MTPVQLAQKAFATLTLPAAGSAGVSVRGEVAGRASIHSGAGSDLVLDHASVISTQDRPRRRWTSVGSGDGDACDAHVCPR